MVFWCDLEVPGVTNGVRASGYSRRCCPDSNGHLLRSLGVNARGRLRSRGQVWPDQTGTNLAPVVPAEATSPTRQHVGSVGEMRPASPLLCDMAVEPRAGLFDERLRHLQSALDVVAAPTSSRPQVIIGLASLFGKV